jgi:hypothetical protein
MFLRIMKDLRASVRPWGLSEAFKGHIDEGLLKTLKELLKFLEPLSCP